MLLDFATPYRLIDACFPNNSNDYTSRSVIGVSFSPNSAEARIVKGLQKLELTDRATPPMASPDTSKEGHELANYTDIPES